MPSNLAAVSTREDQGSAFAKLTDDISIRQQILDALPPLRAFARFLCGKVERAEELVQKTVRRALANPDKFEPGTNLHAWLFTILRNQLYSEGRTRRRASEDINDRSGEVLTPKAETDGVIEVGDLHRLLSGLREEQSEALLLVAGYGFSYKEVSAMTGIALGTVKSRVARARTRLVDHSSTPSHVRRRRGRNPDVVQALFCTRFGLSSGPRAGAP